MFPEEHSDEIFDLYDAYLESGGVCTDTRKLNKDELFVALKGPNFDGNAYVQQALDKGASAVVTDDPAWKLIDNERIFFREDALYALQYLARIHVDVMTGLGYEVFAITGSNGKTTTKELFRSIVGDDEMFDFTEGNLNNHIGVPLTILKNRPEEVGYLVMEFGDNHLGDIETLCHIARPRGAMVTNIGEDHLGEFGSMENNIASKMQLYDYVYQKYIRSQTGFFKSRDYKFCFNLTEPVIEQFYLNHKIDTDYANAYGKGQIVSRPFIQGTIVSDTPKGLQVRMILGEETFTVKTALRGRFNLQNILAATAIAVGYDRFVESDIRNGLESYVPDNMRSQWIDKGKYQIFLDAYNANPSSMREAIKSVFQWKGEKVVLFLGDMLELGEFSAQAHEDLLTFIEKFKPKAVVTVGEHFARAAQTKSYAYPIQSVESVDDFKDSWKKTVSDTEATIVLIKGSRSLKMEEVLHYLD